MNKSKISTLCEADKIIIHCQQIYFIKMFRQNSPNMNGNEEPNSLLPSGNNKHQNKTKKRNNTYQLEKKVCNY